MTHQRSRQLVEHQQLAASRCHRESLVTELVVDHVAVETRCVDDPARGDLRAVVERHDARVITHLYAGDAMPQVERDTEAHGLDREGQRHRPRIDDALARHLDRTQCAGSKVRLARVEILDRDAPCLGIAVSSGLVLDGIKGRELLVVPRDEQGAKSFDGDSR